MIERVQKIIANAGYSSRRKAEELIASGKVKINDRIAKLGDRADITKDNIFIDGKKLELTQHLVYYAAYKPKGYTSTVLDPHSKLNVVDLVPKEPRVFPVGRLDKDSEGLILLTNDGELANILTHPRYESEKEYNVIVSYKKDVPKNEILDKIKHLELGVKIDGKMTSPAKITLKKVSNLIEFNIVIHEGRKRQIRRMCAAVSWNIEKLTRIRISKLDIGKLKPKEFIKISKENII